MLRSFKLGSAFGIPLFLHWSFLLLPAWALFLARHEGLTGILFAQAVLFSLFGCVLMHELGHALMARFFGIPTRDITLYPIGGVARLESTGRRPLEEICVALAGPAVNLVIVLILTPFVGFILAAGMLRGPTAAVIGPSANPLSFFAAYLFTLWFGNGILLLFNLAPAFPMDGGRVLRGILALRMGLLRATETAAVVGLVASAAMAIVGASIGNPVLVLVSVVVAVLGQHEALAVRQHEAARRLRAVEVSVPATPVHTRLEGFTGFLWDCDRCAWVRWVDGQPVERA